MVKKLTNMMEINLYTIKGNVKAEGPFENNQI